MEIKICHLYPDVLNLYGDRGNIICLERRLNWRGICCSVTELPLGEKAALSDFDLFFIGGGQDFEQELLLADLASGKADDIRAAAADGKTFLCICGGYQLMGAYYETAEGHKCDFLGAVDLYTVGARERMIGNLSFKLGEESGGYEVIGFENHSGRTFLGSGVSPLGTVTSGFGNNGADKTEGVRWNNVFGTYSHGPVLPKNPALCDEILRCALERRYGRAELTPLADGFEQDAHRAALEMVNRKKQ